MKNILQAIKSCMNGLRTYVDKTAAKLATQEDTEEIKGLVDNAQDAADNAQATADNAQATAEQQADWDDSNVNSVSYVKNRTHYARYTAGEPMTVRLTFDYDNSKVLPSETNGNIGYSLVHFTESAGVKFHSYANYQPLIYDGVDEEGNYLFSANITWNQVWVRFVVSADYGEVRVSSSNYYSPSVDIQWLEAKFEPKQLDEAYIPDTVARTADVIPLPATASVGQTIRVSAVDENGKPTAWEAVDFEEDWELISEVTIEEEIQTVAQLWEPMKKVRIEVYTPAAAADTNNMPVTIYTTDDHSQSFVTGRFYPTALPRKSEYYSEYRVAMEEYDGKIIMRFTESNDLVRNSSRIVGSGTLKEVTSDGNSGYADKFENVYTTGMHLHSYSLFPVGSTFKFWGVRA